MKNTDRRPRGAGGSQNLNVQPGRSREMPGMLRDVLAKIVRFCESANIFSN